MKKVALITGITGQARLPGRIPAAQGLEKKTRLDQASTNELRGLVQEGISACNGICLRQEPPENFVIPAGVQYSVCQFVAFATGERGVTMRWEGTGVDERDIVAAIQRQAGQVQGRRAGAARRHHGVRAPRMGTPAARPIREDHLLTGLLEPTHEPDAIARIAGIKIKMCEADNAQYGRQYTSAVPSNLHHPNDHCDLADVCVLLVERGRASQDFLARFAA